MRYYLLLPSVYCWWGRCYLVEMELRYKKPFVWAGMLRRGVEDEKEQGTGKQDIIQRVIEW